MNPTGDKSGEGAKFPLNGPGSRGRGARPRVVPGRLVATALIGAMVVLAGCASKRSGDIPYSRADFVSPDLPRMTSTADEHLLQPGDVVTVNVFQVEAVSGDRQVDQSGQVQIPLVGAVPAQGKTVKTLAADLTTRLDATYLRNPRVEVLLKSAQLRSVTIDGSVKQAGVYPIPGDITLLQAIALARGTDMNANEKRVVVFRQIEGQRQAAAFDLTTIRNGQDPDPAIHGDDIIVVDGSKSRQTFRDFVMTVPLLAFFRIF